MLSRALVINYNLRYFKQIISSTFSHKIHSLGKFGNQVWSWQSFILYQYVLYDIRISSIEILNLAIKISFYTLELSDRNSVRFSSILPFESIKISYFVLVFSQISFICKFINLFFKNLLRQAVSGMKIFIVFVFFGHPCDLVISTHQHAKLFLEIFFPNLFGC